MQTTFQHKKRKHVVLISTGYICVHTYHNQASIALDTRKFGYDVGARLPSRSPVQAFSEELSRPCK